MRVCTNENDPGFENFIKLGGPKGIKAVTLDGVEVDDCDLADDEEGFVRVAVKDATGFLKIVNDEIVTEIRRGSVVIVT